VPLVISRPLTIRGIDDELVTIAGNSETQDRVITIGPEIAVQLFRLRIEGGNEEDPPGGFPDEGLGGALYVPVSSSLAVTDSEIVNNRAVSGGGIWSAGPLTLTRTTVADNVAFGVGAGLGLGGGVALNNTSTPVTFTNTTFGRNEAFGFGGGIYTERPMTMRSVSIVENEAPVPDPDNHGGGLHQVFTPGEQTVASNTLVALNVGGGCGGTFNFPIASTRGLLDEIGATLPSCNVTPNPGDNIIADSLVGFLEDNGGLTRTYSLLANSPAIDAGASCPADDQRGFPRRIFACDIGTYGSARRI
jgi:predicted outer membrane repeat protein